MRFVFALASLSALAFAHAASAAPVTLAPISFSPEFQSELEDEYGVREGDYLQQTVHDAVAAELQRRGATLNGGGGLTIEIAIVGAEPNRPTMQQLSNTPGLDGFRSISIGGAELRAVVRDANGAVLSEVSHRRYNHSLADIGGAASTWTEANRAIRRFAVKVADAYEANAH